MQMRRYLSGLMACAVAALAGRALAAEPNNTPATATQLPIGQMSVFDSLDGRAGRPDTLLGLFNPALTVLELSDDNSSPLGNNFASQLIGIPLRPDGSIYFKITGAPDGTFAGNHTQSGNYQYFLDVRDPNGNLVPSLSISQIDELSPGARDSIWLDPSPSPDPGNPNWAGYTVDMTINNIVGPGTGDSRDFFVFNGLEPFQEFTATLTADFAAKMALFDSVNNLVTTSSLVNGLNQLTGTADFMGRVKIGVTGADDVNFTGAHVNFGQYGIVLTTVLPEPAGIAMLGLGLAALAWCGRQYRGRRRS
jgi:hypothetical protein